MMKSVILFLSLIVLLGGVTPSFAQAPPPGRSIAVLKVGTGTGTVVTSIGNVSCGVAPAPVVCLSTFRLKFGTPVTITALASTGSVFAGWVGLPVACAHTSCQFVMPNQHVQVRATFTLIPPTGAAVSPDTVAPSAPILRGYAHSPTILQLEWPQVTDNEGVHSFILQRCIGVSSTCTLWTVVSPSIASLTFLNTGLRANTDYVFRLQARDWAGNLSAWSEILTLKTPATGSVAWTLSPLSITTTRNTNEDPNTPLPRFTVSIVNTGTVGLTLTWSTALAWIVGLIPENGQLTIAPRATGTYSFQVTSIPWGCVGGCPLPPQAPAYTGTISIAGGASTKLLTVNLNIRGRAKLTWDPLTVPMLNVDGSVLLNPGLPLLNPDGTPQLNPDGTPALAPGVPVIAIGYHVWRSLVPGVHPIGPLNYSPTWNLGAPVATVIIGTNTFTDTSLLVGTTYYYVVTSWNEAGDSPPSNEVSIMVTTTTGAP